MLFREGTAIEPLFLSPLVPSTALPSAAVTARRRRENIPDIVRLF